MLFTRIPVFEPFAISSISSTSTGLTFSSSTSSLFYPYFPCAFNNTRMGIFRSIFSPRGFLGPLLSLLSLVFVSIALTLPWFSFHEFRYVVPDKEFPPPDADFTEFEYAQISHSRGWYMGSCFSKSKYELPLPLRCPEDMNGAYFWRTTECDYYRLTCAPLRSINNLMFIGMSSSLFLTFFHSYKSFKRSFGVAKVGRSRWQIISGSSAFLIILASAAYYTSEGSTSIRLAYQHSSMGCDSYGGYCSLLYGISSSTMYERRENVWHRSVMEIEPKGWFYAWYACGAMAASLLYTLRTVTPQSLIEDNDDYLEGDDLQVPLNQDL